MPQGNSLINLFYPNKIIYQS